MLFPSRRRRRRRCAQVLFEPRAIGEGWSNRNRQQRRLDGCDAVVVD